MNSNSNSRHLAMTTSGKFPSFDSATMDTKTSKKARTQPGGDDSSSGKLSAQSKISSSSTCSFSFENRQSQHTRILSGEIPDISVVMAPPVAEESFSWADLPLSSRHYSTDEGTPIVAPLANSTLSMESC